MPTIPHYNLDVDDLVGMDYLTFAKKRMIRDIKTDKSIENADKYISETSFKDTGDTSISTNNIKEIFNIWNKSYILLSQVGNKITKPANVNSNGADGNTGLIKQDALVSAEIIDKTNIINSNLIEILDKLSYILKNPSTIKNLPQTDIYKIYDFYNKWISKLLGNSGVLTSQVFRLILDVATGRFVKSRPFNDRLGRRVGAPAGVVDFETIFSNFQDILNNWYNFRDLWNVFLKVYNSKPA